VSISDNPELADEFAHLAQQKAGDQAGNVEANVPPLLHRTSRPASVPLPHEVLNQEVFGTVLDAWEMGHDALRMTNYTTASIKKPGCPGSVVLSVLHRVVISIADSNASAHMGFRQRPIAERYANYHVQQLRVLLGFKPFHSILNTHVALPIPPFVHKSSSCRYRYWKTKPSMRPPKFPGVALWLEPLPYPRSVTPAVLIVS
jgi:hypothetical protein